MNPLFALAGLAEAAMAEQVVLFFLALLFIGVLVFVVLFADSRKVTVACLVLWGLVSFCFQPWDYFFLRPSEDSDWESFRTTFESQGRWWLGLSITLLAVSALVFVVKRIWKKKPYSTPTSENIRDPLIFHIIFVILLIVLCVYFGYRAK